jgi:exonuclease VII large subunit
VEKVFVREHLEIRYIVLTGTQKRMVWSIRCTFDKESSSKLTRLNEGQEVVVRGKYDGYGKNIIFKDCVLV